MNDQELTLFDKLKAADIKRKAKYIRNQNAYREKHPEQWREYNRLKQREYAEKRNARRKELRKEKKAAEEALEMLTTLAMATGF
jgi:hypothetical protein